MQTTASGSSHITNTGLAESKGCSGCAEGLRFSYLAGEQVKRYSHVEEQLESYKVQYNTHHTTQQPCCIRPDKGVPPSPLKSRHNCPQQRRAGNHPHAGQVVSGRRRGKYPWLWSTTQRGKGTEGLDESEKTTRCEIELLQSSRRGRTAVRKAAHGSLGAGGGRGALTTTAEGNWG